MASVAVPIQMTQIGPGAQRVTHPLDPLVKAESISLNVNDRQDHQDTLATSPAPHKHKSAFRYWMRRILIGKTEREELVEAKHHKKLNFLKMEVRRHMVEFVGSAFIVLFIAGIQVNQDLFPQGGVANVDKGFIAGALLTGLIYCFGQISGAHFNPCVTLAFLLRGSFYFPRFVSYVVVQFAGAVSGAAILYGFFGNVGPGLGTTMPGPGIDNEVAFGIETLITFLLITVVLTTSVSAHVMGVTSGLAVGAMFGALQMWAWNFTGASANPWRTIGPTLISDVGWDTYWIYIVGPLLGTFVAVLLQRLMVTGFSRYDVRDAGSGGGKLVTGSKILDEKIV